MLVIAALCVAGMVGAVCFALAAAGALGGAIAEPVAGRAVVGITVALASGGAGLTLAVLVVQLAVDTVTTVVRAAGSPAPAAATARPGRVTARLAAIVLGVGVIASPAAALGAPAHIPAASVSGPSTAGSQDAAPPSAHDTVHPGWTPPPPPSAPSLPTPALRVADAGRLAGLGPVASTAAAEIVVRRGDSLWSLAARHLGPDATDAQIAAEWPDWYATNTDAIGDDPHLLLPGQRLRPPTA